MSELEPLPSVIGGMIEPQHLKRKILAAVQEGYAALAEARGEVTVAEDTFDVQRRLTDARERLKGYADAFNDGAKMVSTLQEEELVDAVGEQDGIPMSGLTVPDPQGDIRITVNNENSYDVDTDQLLAAVAARALIGPSGRPVADSLRAVVEGDERDPDDLEDILHSLLLGALRQLLRAGKFTPQVTKVKAYAAELSRSGRDDLAAIVSGALTKTTTYKGVTVNRKGLET